MHTFLTGLIAHGASSQTMTEKRVAFQCDPLPEVFMAMSDEPFLLSLPCANPWRHGDVGDHDDNPLVLRQGQRFERTENASFEYGFQLSHHVFIVAGRRDPRTLNVRTDAVRTPATPNLSSLWQYKKRGLRHDASGRRPCSGWCSDF